MPGSILKILRSSTAGNRPSGRAYGEPYVNLADGQFGVVNSSGANVDLLGVPIFSTLASYPANFTVNNGGRLYRSLGAITPGAFNGANWSQLVTSSDVGTGYLPLTGGTLTGALTLAADPAANLQAATKQYVDNKPSGGAPSGGYFYMVNTGLCQFIPEFGNTIRINGIDRIFPATNVNYNNTYIEGTPGQAMAANTVYYIYMFWSGSAVVANLSQTGWGFSNGVAVKGNDASQTLVGMVRSDNGGAFADTSNTKWVISWFNRRLKTSVVGLGNSSTGSSGWVGLGAVNYFISWGDMDVLSWSNGQFAITNTSSGYGQACIGIDGSPSFGSSIQFTTAYQNVSGGTGCTVIGSGPVNSPGLHYNQVFIACTGGGTTYWNNANLLTQFWG